LLIKLTVLALQQDNAILPSGSREHPGMRTFMAWLLEVEQYIIVQGIMD
jgi:hypothetical protein